jgi:branched-chain amino acid transport system permease protein
LQNNAARERTALLVLVGALCVLPLLTSNVNVHHVIVMFLIYAALGEAWNIVTGLAGQTSFGHASFFGIGAYCAAMAWFKFRVTPWVGVLVGVALSAALAVVVSYPVFRLKGHYFAVATLAVGEIVMQLFVSWRWVEGATGIIIPVAKEGLTTFQFHSSKLPYIYISIAVFALCALAFHYVSRSKFGFRLKAIRGSEEAAMAIGIDPARNKLAAMVLSAALASVAGSVYAQYILYIDPFMVFATSISIKIVLLTVLGGLGSIWGPVLGSAILIPLSEYTRVAFGGTGRGIDLIIFGTLIVIVACFQPQGIIGLVRAASSRASKGGVTPDAGKAGTAA